MHAHESQKPNTHLFPGLWAVVLSERHHRRKHCVDVMSVQTLLPPPEPAGQVHGSAPTPTPDKQSQASSLSFWFSMVLMFYSQVMNKNIIWGSDVLLLCGYNSLMNRHRAVYIHNSSTELQCESAYTHTHTPSNNPFKVQADLIYSRDIKKSSTMSTYNRPIPTLQVGLVVDVDNSWQHELQNKYVTYMD